MTMQDSTTAATTTGAETDERGPQRRIYDEQVAPIIRQAHDICKANNIAFVAGVGFDSEGEEERVGIKATYAGSFRDYSRIIVATAVLEGKLEQLISANLPEILEAVQS